MWPVGGADEWKGESSPGSGAGEGYGGRGCETEGKLGCFAL